VYIGAGGRVRAFGDNRHGQCTVPAAAAGGDGSRGAAGDDGWVAVAAGLHHSGAISRRGSLVLWGHNRHGQCGGGDDEGGAVGGTRTVVDTVSTVEGVSAVACGAKHSVWITDNGQLWSCGDDLWGQRGRGGRCEGGDSAAAAGSGGGMEAAPILVRAVKCKVRWTRVDCGWSHSIARGVDEHGHSVVVGWGRNTFGQLASMPVEPPHSEGRASTSEPASGSRSGSVSASARVLEPTLLPDLPTGPVDEAWCGSEFTAATDTVGRVFMRGWNEHHNLGCGEAIDGTTAAIIAATTASATATAAATAAATTSATTTATATASAAWVPVRRADGSQLVLQDYPWTGSLALGGGHCLAFGLQ